MFKLQTSKVVEFKPQRIKSISVISEIRSSNQKVDCELREWHELYSNRFSVISEIRSSNQKVNCELCEWHELYSNRFSVIGEIRSWYYFAIMIREIRNMYSNFFYILVDERVGERVKKVIFRSLCKCFIINKLWRSDFKGAY